MLWKQSSVVLGPLDTSRSGSVLSVLYKTQNLRDFHFLLTLSNQLLTNKKKKNIGAIASWQTYQ